ncbi:AfsR/SARP family transcriptional regulator [Streptomyces sp. NL15-2K]|uniref:AfsR/SARP family transcriptional regulator n=1 Tax=Streptomyces sp. NL15-2K TaxID=376149 RepID=UPI000FFA659D|nr:MULTISPECIES: AfsR/SARP family transcriptional regulator [Actinomycetes]WKX06031.1 AfsR/SARP family transcriptional regulator [Kutzneria buriramensis]GCB53297.1 regulatory protein [Streptomyces sp. NL15-2K]
MVLQSDILPKRRVRYEILGPLRISVEERSAAISAHKVELLLAVLLIRADHIVTAGQLIDELWGGRPPGRATAGLHVYVSELRKFLDRQNISDRPIETCSPGYLLRQDSAEIDFQTFLTLLRSGRKAAAECRNEEAIDFLERALSLWRGPVLGGFAEGPIVSNFITWLNEEQTECLELLVESQLQLGRHREVVGMLFSLIAESPLHEAFYRQLMLALYRSERKADALRVYQKARGILSDELGLDPCRTLQSMQRSILLDEESLLHASLSA